MAVLRRLQGTNEGLWFRGQEWKNNKDGRIENFPDNLTKDEREQLNAHGFALEPAIMVNRPEVEHEVGIGAKSIPKDEKDKAEKDKDTGDKVIVAPKTEEKKDDKVVVAKQ